MINKIFVNTETRIAVPVDKDFLGIAGENDYEVLQIELDKGLITEGSAPILEIEFPNDKKKYLQMTRIDEKTAMIEVKNSLLNQPGFLNLQFVLSNSERVVFKSEIFSMKVNEAINVNVEPGEEYPTWIANLEKLKSELNKSESERVEAEESRVKAEDVRVLNENERNTSEQERIDNENIRNENEEARIENEQARIANEETRETNETNRINSEKDRETAETKRSEDETVRQQNEETRENNETNRVEAEGLREQAEEERKNNEDTRTENEQARIDNEEARETNETNRTNSENDRETAETKRAEGEVVRQQNEETRKNNETSRIEAEGLRVIAEEERKANEVSREEKIIQLQKENQELASNMHWSEKAGETIDINDAHKYSGNSLSIINGKQFQETQEGTSNLVILEEGEHTNGEVTFIITDGVITAIGSNTASESVTLKIGEAFLHAGKTYYMYEFGSSRYTGTWISKSGDSAWFGVEARSFVPKYSGIYKLYGSTGANQTPSPNLKLLITEKADCTEVDWVIGKKQLPSPEYHSEIQAVGDNINKLPYPYAETTKMQNGLEFTDNGDGSITVNGKATVTTYFLIYGGALNQKEIPDGYLNGGINNNIIIQVINYSNNQYTNLSTSAGYPAKINKSTYSTGYIQLRINANTLCENIVIRPKIADSYEKALVWSQSGQGSVELTKVNKNLYTGNLEAGAYNNSTGNAIGSEKYVRTKEFINLVPSKKYKVTVFVAGKKHDSGNILFYKLDGTFISSSQNFSKAIEVPVEARKIKLNIFNTNGILVEDVDSIQIEPGEESTDPVEHQEERDILPIQKPLFDGDCFEKVNGTWKEKHTWSQIILNGSEVHGTLSNERFGLILKDNGYELAKDGYDKIQCISDSFKAVSQRDTTTTDKCCAVNNNMLYVRVKADTTLEDLKADLATNNATIYYKLLEPQHLECTEGQIKVLDKFDGNFELYEGINYIYSNNELSPDLKSIYMQSNKILHDNQEKRILALENLIKNQVTEVAVGGENE